MFWAKTVIPAKHKITVINMRFIILLTIGIWGICRSGKESNVFFEQHCNDVNDPADSEDSARDYPDKPDNYFAAQYTVDALNNRITDNCKNKLDQPVKLVDCCSSHKTPKKIDMTF
jgi:hypothetical protein